jgi:hypothetical protein
MGGGKVGKQVPRFADSARDDSFYLFGTVAYVKFGHYGTNSAGLIDGPGEGA